MARSEHLPIYRATFDLCLHLERLTPKLSKAHRYGLGADLRSAARRCLVRVVRANNRRETPARRLEFEELRIELAEVSALVRLAKEVGALPNLKTYERCANAVVDISKQTEGWLRSLSRQQ